MPRLGRNQDAIEAGEVGVEETHDRPQIGPPLARGEGVALVTVVRTQGSTPQRPGAKMLVFADGRTIGTIGGAVVGGALGNEAGERYDEKKGRR